MDFDTAYAFARAELGHVRDTDGNLAYVLLRLRVAALTIAPPRDDEERGKLAAYREMLDMMTGFENADPWLLVAGVLCDYDLSRPKSR